MSVASHDLFNMKLRTCIDTGENQSHTRASEQQRNGRDWKAMAPSL